MCKITGAANSLGNPNTAYLQQGGRGASCVSAERPASCIQAEPQQTPEFFQFMHVYTRNYIFTLNIFVASETHSLFPYPLSYSREGFQLTIKSKTRWAVMWLFYLGSEREELGNAPTEALKVLAAHKQPSLQSSAHCGWEEGVLPPPRDAPHPCHP